MQLGADDKIAAMAPFVDGYLTEDFDLPLPYGEGKLSRALEYAAARDTGLGDCWFYSDSLADLPLLEAVGHPVAVNPQRKLRKLALERGWDVVDWKDHLEGEAPSVARQLTFSVSGTRARALRPGRVDEAAKS